MCLAHGEQHGVVFQHVCRDLTKRAVIVEDEKPPAECGADQVVFPPLYDYVAVRDVRRAAFEFHPRVAAVNREEDAKLRPDKEEVRFHVILNHAATKYDARANRR